MEFTLWHVFSFLNSLTESCLCFLSTSLHVNPDLACVCVLCLLLFLCYLVGIPSLPTVWETKNRQKHHGRAKRRRQGGTRKGCRYDPREEEEKKRLISILKSPLGQHYDTTRFRQMLCPDLFCEVCNHATAEIHSLLFPEALADATPSVSPLASTVSMTGSSSSLSPAFSTLPPGTPTSRPLSEPVSSPPPILSNNPMIPLPNSPSPLPPGHSFPSEPFCPLASKFPVEHSQPELPGIPSCGTPRGDPLLQLETPLTLHTIFLDPSPFQHTDPFPHLTLTMNPTDSFDYYHTAEVLSTSPSPESNFTVTQADHNKSDHHLNTSESAADQHDSAVTLPFWSSKGKPTEPQFHQQPSYPQAGEDYLLQNRIYFFWGYPSLHSESLPYAAHGLGDYSSIFIFNRIPNASTCQMPPPSLPEVQPQPTPEIVPQSQPLPLTQTLPQAHLPSPLSTLPSGPIPQLRRCGVCFHQPQNELDNVTSSEMQQLEWHVLQKQQERLWGLPAVVQRSQEDFRSSAPDSVHQLRRPLQAQASVSILPGDFALSHELRKTLERHLQKRLMQHRWGLPYRIYKSFLKLRPPSHFSQASKPESNHGLSWLCAHKGKNSKNINVGWSQQGSFSEWGENELRGEGNSPDDIPTDSQSSSNNDLPYDHEEDLGRHRENLLGETAMFSGLSLRQRQIKNILKIHSSNTLEENNLGGQPAPEPSAWHATKQVPTVPVNSHTDTNQGSVPPSVGGDCCLNTCQELSFLDYSAKECLDSHMKNFCGRISLGLPSKVLKSIEIFQSKDSSSHSLLDSNLPSSTNLDSEVGSTSGGFMPLRGSTASLHGDNMGTAHSASVLEHPLPATSHVGQEGQGALSQSPSAIHQDLIRDIQRMRDARQTLQPVRRNLTGKDSVIQTLLINTPSPKLPAVQARATREPKDQSGMSTDRVEKLKGKEMGKESQPVAMPMRQVVRAMELNAPQSRTSDIPTTGKPGISHRIPVNEKRAGTAVSTNNPPAKLPALQDPKSSGSQEQLPYDLQSEIDNRECSQSQGQRSDMAAASVGLVCKASQTRAQGVPTVDMGASQVPHVQGEVRGVGMQQRQVPWRPGHVLRCGQDKNFPPAKQTVSHQGPKSETLGGDPGFRTSQTGRKNVSEMLGSKSSQTLSQEGLSPPERPFRMKVQHFFQWLHSGVKSDHQDNSQGKGSPVTSVGSRGPEKSRAAWSGPTEAQKVMTGLGKFLQEKLGHCQATDIPCPQEPLPAPGKFGKPHQKVQVRAQSGPTQGHPSISRAPCCKVTKSCQQAAGFAGQSFTNIRQTRVKDRQAHQNVAVFKEQFSSQKHLVSWPCREAVPHPSFGQSSTSIRQRSNKEREPQKAATFKEQFICQKHPGSSPHRQAVPHPSHTYRRQAGQGPNAALTTAEGTAFRDGSLLLRHKTILQHLQQKNISTPD